MSGAMAGAGKAGREDVRKGPGGHPHGYLGGGAVRRCGRGAVSGDESGEGGMWTALAGFLL